MLRIQWSEQVQAEIVPVVPSGPTADLVICEDTAIPFPSSNARSIQYMLMSCPAGSGIDGSLLAIHYRTSGQTALRLYQVGNWGIGTLQTHLHHLSE